MIRFWFSCICCAVFPDYIFMDENGNKLHGVNQAVWWWVKMRYPKEQSVIIIPLKIDVKIVFLLEG